jgi:hypothetical protein
MSSSRSDSRFIAAVVVVFLLAATAAWAQSTATLQGTVTDQTGAVVPNAQVKATNEATSLERASRTDATGNYTIPSLPAGAYTIEVTAPALQHQVLRGYVIEVSRNVAQNFRLKPATVEQSVVITGEAPVVDAGTITVGAVVDNRTVQEIPLNGRHFVDLASLVPGTVVPPVQNAFLTAALRGQGSFAVVTAGNREDTTNFMINGINLNDMANGQITFQPSINTVSEFKIDNQTPSADHGRNSGAIVNIATRSGSNSWHGEGFEFLRNEDFDARNFFNKEEGPTAQPKNTFKRNNFGGAIGGPIWKNHTFFFASYEGLRQRQGLALSANVPSAAQRAAVTDPTVQKLVALLPAGSGGSATTPASFSGPATAPVNIDQWTGDVSHNFSERDRFHVYYAFQRDLRKEPNIQGATVPNSGDTRQSHRQIMTFNETHVFNPRLVNDFRLGYNRIHITFAPDVQNAGLDPSALGIQDGLSGPVGIPNIVVNGASLIFGGELNLPQARGDYTAVLSDSLSYVRGRHAFKFGGEVRRFNGNSIQGDEGRLTFTNLNDFLGVPPSGTGPYGPSRPSGFQINLGGNHPARIYQHAIGLFAMDSFKLKPYFTLELGLRWEWNMTPTEAMNRSTVFLPDKDWLVQLGSNGVSEEFHQNTHLFQPRVGFSWDLFHDGKMVLRSGYAIMYDQLIPSFILAGSLNPPFGRPVQFTPTTGKPFTNFGTLAQDAGGSLTINTTDPNYNYPYMQTWNLNLQTELTPSLGMMIGYFGSKGTHLNEDPNLNQPINGVRPFAKLAADSPIFPGAGLGNITLNESMGNSSYNALWVTGTKRLTHGLQFAANYTWSKSIDWNSRNFLGTSFQDSRNPQLDRGLSDFDARHHFTLSTIYEIPALRANRAFQGWRISSAVALQSGNPLNIVANAASITGFNGVVFAGNPTIRPDLIGALPSVGKSLITSGSLAGNVQWFPTAIVCDPRVAGSCNANSVFAIPATAAGFHFGDLGRNVLVGPGFANVDMSVSKTTKITERLSHELRVEAFDLFNHPNFSNPNLTAQVGNSNFGVIKATRAPTGDAGSSRQIQFAMKLIF